MTCAIYARFARDEEYAYKTEVSNELLKAFGFRIPMRSYKLTPSMIEYIDRCASFKSGESAQQAAERIKQHVICKERVLDAFYAMEKHERCKFDHFTWVARKRLMVSGQNDICRKNLTCFDKKHCVLT